METDASNFTLKAVVLQIGEEEKLHSIAFYFGKKLGVEINYKIYNK